MAYLSLAGVFAGPSVTVSSHLLFSEASDLFICVLCRFLIWRSSLKKKKRKSMIIASATMFVWLAHQSYKGYLIRKELILFLWLLFHFPHFDFLMQFEIQEAVKVAGNVCPVMGSAFLLFQTNFRQSHMKEWINLQLLWWKKNPPTTRIGDDDRIVSLTKERDRSGLAS